MKRNCVTGLVPFTTILLQELPSRATLDKLTGTLEDVPDDTPPRYLKRKLLHRVAAVKTVNRRLEAAKQR